MSNDADQKPKWQVRRDELALAERIFEPKYGGKDHSGYDTLLKYEVNGYLQESFERGYDAAHVNALAEIESLRVENEKIRNDKMSIRKAWNNEVRENEQQQILINDLEAEIDKLHEEKIPVEKATAIIIENLKDEYMNIRKAWNNEVRENEDKQVTINIIEAEIESLRAENEKLRIENEPTKSDKLLLSKVNLPSGDYLEIFNDETVRLNGTHELFKKDLNNT